MCNYVKDLAQIVLNVADLALNPLTKIVMRSGKVIVLTAKEYMLLEYLIRHKNTIVNEHTLETQLFNFERQCKSNILHQVYMYRLRTKIDKNYTLKLIKTHRNLGYIISETLFKNLKLRLLTTLFILCALFYGFGYIIVYAARRESQKKYRGFFIHSFKR